MATGHLKYEEKPLGEVYKALGEGDTSDIFERQVTIDHSHTVAYGAGTSVGYPQTVYIDSQLWKDIKGGKIRCKELDADQIIRRIVEHEHTEKSITDGDNPVDTYPPAHEMATAKEHEDIRNPEAYEASLKAALDACAKRPQTNPPRDLWCEPYLDEPDRESKRILREYQAKGVVDAFKKSKYEARYGYGAARCDDCKWAGKFKDDLAPCDMVSGLIRCDRQCDYFAAKR